MASVELEEAVPRPGDTCTHTNGYDGTVISCDGVTVEVECPGMTWTGSVERFEEEWKLDP